MTLSEQAWNKASRIIAAIKQHPFNQELMKGTLALDKFAYYIEQDAIYLQDFARCQALIAAKVPLKYVRSFLRYADYTFIAEQEIVHQFFREIFSFQETGQLTPATLSYTSWLRAVCSQEPVEVGVAAILPCFWVYREVGLNIARQADPENPFFRWIETYTSQDFDNTVNEAIHICDSLAKKTTDEIRLRMLEVFYKSTCLEWHFWNDAYHTAVFDNILPPSPDFLV